jgi:hypothetical protein
MRWADGRSHHIYSLTSYASLIPDTSHTSHTSYYMVRHWANTSTQGRLRSPHHQQGWWPGLQPILCAGTAEDGVQRLPHPCRHLSWYPCYLPLHMPSTVPSIATRQPSPLGYRHTVSRVFALSLDLLSDGDGHQVPALYQPGAAQHRDSGSKMSRNLRRVCHGQSVLQLGDAHSGRQV